jgi:chaperonin cofactor prefoldin
MDEQGTQQLIASAERLAAAAETLEKALLRLDAQQEELSQKVERIVAAIDERLPLEVAEEGDGPAKQALETRVAELEKANEELKAQAGRLARKTLPSLVTTLLAKSGAEPSENMDTATLDKTLSALSPEQRIAVKAEMARAGLIA